MSISFVSAGSVVTATSGTLSIPVPSSYSAGDLFVLAIAQNNNGSISAPTGWTSAGGTNNGGGLRTFVFYKTAASSESALAFNTSSNATKAVMINYRGTGAYGLTLDASTTSTGNSTSLGSGTVTTSQANDVILNVWGTQTSTATYTAPAAQTARVNSSSSATLNGLLLSDEVQASAGTSTARTATASVTVLYVALTLAIKEITARYWIGGSGTWDNSTTTNWSLTSGGTGGASAPSSVDPAIIDSNSGTGTITTSGGAGTPSCGDLTVTASQAITLGGASLSIYGSVSLPSGGSFALTTAALTFASTSGIKTITSNGKTIPSTIDFAGNGGYWSLVDAFSTSGTLTVTGSNNATFDSNSQNVSCGTVTISQSGRGITMGSSTWNVTGGWLVTAGTITANTSTINLINNTSTSRSFSGPSGTTYYNLVLSGSGSGTAAFLTNNTFNSITVSRTAAFTLTLPAGLTTTATTFSGSGSSGNIMTIASDGASTFTSSTLAVTNTFTSNYTYVKYVDMSVSGKGTVSNGVLLNANNWSAINNTSIVKALTTGSNGSLWTVPSDWNSSNNSINVIGGGGGGLTSATNAGNNRAGGPGGGGGGFTRIVNQAYTPGATYYYQVGAKGSAGATGGTSYWNGSAQTPAYVSSALSTQTTGGSSITMTVPSVSNGNFMVMIVVSANTARNWSTPAGWTSDQVLGGGGLNGVQVFYRTASSEPASYTVSLSAGSNNATGIILAYNNAVYNNTSTVTTGTGTITPPALTVGNANSVIIYVASAAAVSTSYTTPTGYTLRQSDSDATSPSLTAFDILGVAAGSYTAPSTTVTGSSSRVFTIALSPAIGAYALTATGGSPGSITIATPSSTGGTGGSGSGGSSNYTGGTGGAGAVVTASTTTACGSGGGGGAAGPNGNGGTGGAGYANTSNNASSGGGGGGNGGGTSGGNGSSGTGGTGGNNSLGSGGGATTATSGTNGGGGAGGAGGSSSGGSGGDGIDIASIVGSGGGAGGIGGNNAPANTAGLFGGGGAGGSCSNSGGTNAGSDGAQGAIIIAYNSTATSGNSGFFFFM